jgi:NTP pyrophosphatase (non-canonical NTP hydrolase)
MNLRQWKSKKVPIEVLALKLCEESGEVAKELTEAWKRGNKPNISRTISELDHVIAFAEILKERVRDGRR